MKEYRVNFNPISKAIWQLKQVCKYSEKKILALLDSEYGNASWANETKEITANSLVRVRSNCCLWAAPGQYSGRGRPRKHGDKFKLNDNSTWWDATETVEVTSAKFGDILVRKWSRLHFRNSSSVEMELILVERLYGHKQKSKFKPLWLVWIGENILSLELIWEKYLRRFAFLPLVSICQAKIALDFTSFKYTTSM